VNTSSATNLLLGANDIHEATVTSNGYSGQFGQLAGAQVNYVTKSGGNQFHGNAVYSICLCGDECHQEDLQRSGQHNERGVESLAVILQLLAGHDLSHLHQISRYIQALESRG
jgi:hypothetical protein